MQSILFIFGGIALGAATAIYMPMNSQIAKQLGSTIAANVLFYGIGFITTIALLFMFSQSSAIANVKEVRPYLFSAGVLSALMVLGMTYLIPMLGARKLFILLVSGQVLMAMMVSHFQWFGGIEDPITLRKLLGASLVIIGVAITAS